MKPTVEDIKHGTQSPNGGRGAISDEYFAGLFDGCGEIITTKEKVQGRYEKYPRIRMKILVPNLGIKISGRDNMIRFLKRIKDLVILKREHVALALQFCETIGDDPFPLKSTEKGLREIVYARLRVLGGSK